MRVNVRLWPQYPIRFVSARGAKLKIGSRGIFVDVPHELYRFINDVYGRYGKGGIENREVKREFKKYKNRNRNLVFKGKDIASISIVTEPFAPSKSTLRVKVNWELLLDYLENKSKQAFDKSPNLREAARSIYDEIDGNYISIRGIARDSLRITARTREDFKRFLRRTGDYSALSASLDNLLSLIRATPDRSIPEFGFYLANIENIVQNMKDAFDGLLLPSVYYFARSFIEELTRFIVYSRAYDSKDFTLKIDDKETVFPPEYPFRDPNNKYRGYRDVNDLMKEYRKFFTELEGKAKNGRLDNAARLEIPCLRVCKDSINSCKKKYGLATSKMDEFYEACSYVLHNIRPLPFYSPLETKFLMHFMRMLETDVSGVVHSLFGTHYIAQGKNEQESVSYNKVAEIMRSLDAVHREDIREVVKQAMVKKENDDIFFKPPILASIFAILSPSWEALKENMLTKKDVDIFVEKMSAFTFRIGLDLEYERTVRIMEDRIMGQLEGLDPRISSLSKREKGLFLLYLLLAHLPKFIENAKF